MKRPIKIKADAPCQPLFTFGIIHQQIKAITFMHKRAIGLFLEKLIKIIRN
jgi:hypothetical protein